MHCLSGSSLCLWVSMSHCFSGSLIVSLSLGLSLPLWISHCLFLSLWVSVDLCLSGSFTVSLGLSLSLSLSLWVSYCLSDFSVSAGLSLSLWVPHCLSLPLVSVSGQRQRVGVRETESSGAAGRAGRSGCLSKEPH